jgi:hypothetical protein
MSDPTPKVSASKYPAQAAAKVILRVKNSGTAGTLYHGQQLIRQCSNCPPNPAPVSTSPIPDTLPP